MGEGSYFVQILCRELEQHGTADTVLELFTRTIRVVTEVKGDMVPIFRVSAENYLQGGSRGQARGFV